MSAEDATLLERWQTRRDPDAFAEIVARHAGLVYATCRRVLGDAAEAQDAAQECFLELAQARRLEIRASLAPWLHTVALHRSLDRIRTEKRRRSREARYAAEQPATARADVDDLFAHVDEAIAALPDDLRVPLVHRYLEGMTREAIAHRLGVSVSTVHRRLERAAEKVRRFLARRGVRVSGVALATALGGGLAEAAPASMTAALGKVALAGGAPASWGASGTAATTLGGLLVMKKALIAGGAVVLVALAAWWAANETKPKARPLPVTIAYEDPASEAPSAEPADAPAPDTPPQQAALTPEEQAEAAKLPRGSLSGRVYDAKTGAGVPDVRVQATAYLPEKELLLDKVFGNAGGPDNRWPNALTDASGRYSIPDAVAGGSFVYLKWEGLQGYPHKFRCVYNVKVEPGKNTDGVDFALERGVSVSGRVVDEHERPVADAEVNCLPTWNPTSEDTRNRDTTRTDARGWFQVFGIEPNTSASLIARSPEVAVMEPATVAVGEADVTGVVLTAQRTASLAGRAVDTQNRPLEGWYVTARSRIGSADGKTGPGGVFEVVGIPAGTCWLALGPWQSPLYSAGEVELDPGQRLTGMRLTCAAGRPLTGRVLDPDGKPAPRVYVNADSSGGARTDEEGRFSHYTRNDADTLTLTVTMSPLGWAEVRDVPRGAQNVEIRLQRYGAVRGRVVDALTNEPVPAFGLTHRTLDDFRQWYLAPDGSGMQNLDTLGFASFNDPDGLFELKYVQPGTGTAVVARAPGYVPGFVKIPEVRSGQSYEVVVRLKAGAAVEGVVVNAQGTPVPDAYILKNGDPGPVYWKNQALARSDAQGRFRVDSLPPQPVTLFAAHADYCTASASAVPSAEPAKVVFTLAKGGRIEGTVRGADGPQAEARVRLGDSNGDPIVTGPDGRYFFGKIPAGTVAVGATLKGGGQILTRTAIVEEGASTTVDFDFGGTGTVEGALTVAGAGDGRVRVLLQSPSEAGMRTVEAECEGAAGSYTYRVAQAPTGPATLIAAVETGTGWRAAPGVAVQVEEGRTLHQDLAIGGGGSVEVAVTGAREGERVAVGVLRGRVDSLDLTGIVSPDQLVYSVADRLLGGTMEPPYRLEGLEPGAHTLAVVAFPENGGTPRYSLSPVQITDGQPTRLSAAL